MSENQNDQQENKNDDLNKIIMTGLGAIVHAKEKSQKWFEDMQAKGQASATDMQPMIDEWEKKGREALEHGKTMSSDVISKLQGAIDNLKAEARQLGIDDIAQSLEGLTDDALTTLRDNIEELLQSRKTEE